MKPRDLVISLVLISAIAMGIGQFYMDISDNPEYNLNLTELDSFRQLNQTLTFSEEISNQTNTALRGIPILGEAAAVLIGGLNAFTLVLNIPAYFSGMISDTIGYIGLPAWFGIMVTAIMGIILVFAILSAFLRWEV